MSTLQRLDHSIAHWEKRLRVLQSWASCDSDSEVREMIEHATGRVAHYRRLRQKEENKQ